MRTLILKEFNKLTDDELLEESECDFRYQFLRHIFEPFSRERTSTVSGKEDTGLGFSIVKSIVDAVGVTLRWTRRREKAGAINMQKIRKNL